MWADVLNKSTRVGINQVNGDDKNYYFCVHKEIDFFAMKQP